MGKIYNKVIKNKSFIMLEIEDGMNKEKILVVEDDLDINNLIMETLEEQGYAIVQAFSGSEAMLQLKIEDFQMVLLDLMLPKVSGEELIKHIRKKIKEVDKNEEYIKTVWGIGFKLNN